MNEKSQKWLNFCLEICASIFTLVGIYLGSTTFNGAFCYIFSGFFWFALMHTKNLWGLLPLNVVAFIISWSNLFKAM